VPMTLPRATAMATTDTCQAAKKLERMFGRAPNVRLDRKHDILRIDWYRDDERRHLW
jgi:hypothetical protein